MDGLLSKIIIINRVLHLSSLRSSPEGSKKSLEFTSSSVVDLRCRQIINTVGLGVPTRHYYLGPPLGLQRQAGSGGDDIKVGKNMFRHITTLIF